MKLIEHLKPDQRKQLIKLAGKNPKEYKKQINSKKEKLSEKEILELMGVYRDTYKRGKGGALRNTRG